MKRFYQGWCQFVKKAKEDQGQLVLVDARCALFVNKDSKVSALASGVEHDLTTVLGPNTGVACCNLNSSTFNVQTMALSMFSNKADKEGAQITF